MYFETCRYFTNHELYELFQLDNTRVSKTQQQLEQMHAHQRVTDTALDEHIAYLYSCGRSFYLYSCTVKLVYVSQFPIG